MRALTWQGRRDVRVETVPDPRSSTRPTRSSRSPRARSAARTCTCTRCSARSCTPGDILGHEPMGIVEEVGSEVTHIKPGDRVVIPFNISCGSCWMCDARAVRAVRDDPGPRAGQGRVAVRLHLAVRLGAGRAGRVPAGAAGALRPDQGAGGRAGRAVPVPLRRAADRLAGRAVRRRPRGRHARRARARPDRADGQPDRPAPRRRAGHRRRLGRRPAADGRPARRRGRSTCARSTTSPRR